MAERRITYDNELEIMIEDYLANPLEAELDRVIEGLAEEELAERRAKVQSVLEGREKFEIPSAQVLHNIMESHPDRLIILSTHRPAALKLCDRIYRIGEGKIGEITSEEAQTLNERISSADTRNKREEYPAELSMPMTPPEKDTVKNNTDEGWWNT